MPRTLAGSIAETFSPAIAKRNQNQQRINLAERQFEANQDAAASDKTAKQAQVLEALLDANKKSVASGETSPEEGQFFETQMQSKLAQLRGFSTPGRTLQVDPRKSVTDIGKLHDYMNHLNAQLQQAEESGNDVAYQRLLNQANEVGELINKKTEALPNFQNVNGTIVDFNDPANANRVIQKQEPVGGPKSTTFVRVVQGDEKGKLTFLGPDMRADDPRVDELLSANPNAFIEKVGTGGGGTIEYRGEDGVVRTRTMSGSNSRIKPFTTGTQSKFEQDEAQTNALVVRLMNLHNTLRVDDVGVVAKIAEIFVDEGLAQIFPAIADGQRIINRSKLRLVREAAMRQVSGDDRFSNNDRAAITALLAKEGFFESLPSAKGKLRTVAMVLSERQRLKSELLGRTPLTSMTASQIRDGIKDGTVPRDIGVLFLTTLHGFKSEKSK